MFDDAKVVAHSRVTIVKDKEVHVFERGETIPQELEEEANKAIADGKATISFVTDDPFALDASR